MTFLMHGSMAGVLTGSLTERWRWPLFALGFVIGAFPDIGGVVALFTGDWGFYQALHSLDIPLWTLPVSWPYFVHTGLDSLVHRPEGGWFWWAYIMEAFLWGCLYIIAKPWIRQSGGTS